MRRILAIATLAALTSSAAADPAEDRLVKLGANMAMMAHTMGACEQFLTKEEVDRNLAAITRWSTPDDGRLQELTALFSKWYARGRAEADEWTPERCMAQMREDAAKSEALKKGQ